MSKRIFFVHAEKFMVPVAAALRERGVDIVALTTRGEGAPEAWAAALPGVPALHSTEARSMLLPPSFTGRISPKAARVADIDALAPTAARSLQMLDRMNQRGYSVAELNQTYLHLIGFWRAMLDELRPDGIVMSAGPPMFGFDHVLYQLAKADGLATVMFRHTHVEGHLMIGGDIFDIAGPTPEEIEAAPPAPPDPSQFASPTNDQLHRQAMNLRTIRGKLSWPQIARGMVGRHMLSRIAPDPELLYDPTPRHLELRWLWTRGRIECRRALKLYDSLVAEPDLGQPFVYAPLAMEPEESTLPYGGPFSDTMLTIRTLSEALPPGVRLYVKEHANQFNRKHLFAKGRNQHFYRRLAELPNVTLVPLETDSHELIRRALTVATISGTSAWEAIQLGKPALVFGWPWYLHAPGIIHVDSAAAIRRAVTRIAAGELGANVDHLGRYVRLMRERYLVRAIYATGMLEFKQMTLEEHTTNYADAVARQLGAAGQRARPVLGLV